MFDRIIILPAVLVLALTATGAEAQVRPMIDWQDPRAVAEGEILYAEHCAACHGADLEGQPNWRVRREDGLLPAPPHDPTGHTWHHPDAVLVALTAVGPAELIGNGYQSAMPGFAGVLTEDQIRATLAYIKSTWPPEIIATHNEINRRATEGN